MATTGVLKPLPGVLSVRTPREATVDRAIPAPGRRIEDEGYKSTVVESRKLMIPVILSDLFGGVARSLFQWFGWTSENNNRDLEESRHYAGIGVKTVDFRVAENRKAHNTSDYAVDLIFRRGQPFDVVVEFDQIPDLHEQQIYLEVHLGEKPALHRNTLLRVPIDGEECGWIVKIQKQELATLFLTVCSPPTAVVGRCHLGVSIDVESRWSWRVDKAVLLWRSEPVYLLFNPWCKDDAVYLDDQKLREEYILSDTGLICTSRVRNRVRLRPWVFGQFEEGILEAAIHLLELGLSTQGRGNPVKVTRRMSAVVNSNDDDGVLVGNWSDDYSKGTPPGDWTGSAAILREYMQSLKPVRYGQCWVFSGVTTTLLRCLGIPTRSVTNYNSAHDTDCSMTIDKYFNEDGETVASENKDSVWNFHVWNECWMSRSDLPDGYGGWQLVDGTPQETSDGVYQTGPASLMAIKTGHVYYGYDTEFAFAEVNADVINWSVSFVNGKIVTRKKLRTCTKSIGKMILTKAVGKNKAENITSLYKFREGTEKERLAVQHACSHGSRPDTYVSREREVDFECEISVRPDISIGDDFDVTVKLTNKGKESCTVSKMFISCHACYYTGVVARKCRNVVINDITIQPNETTETSMEVAFTDYADVLVEHGAMKLDVMGQIKETNEIFAEEDNFALASPDLNMMIKAKNGSSNPKLGEEFTLAIDFINPLHNRLTDVQIFLESPKLQKPKSFSFRNQPAKQKVRYNIPFTPRTSGARKLVATMHCRELQGVTGYLEFDVQP
ncbi:protein-glutamine gamma-glutamyltransferase K-like [Ptychodera flava]|uniref:protein-glutamine gamma-glutamyltransferase K-like n=1 Tax=Ptychodera flava TaxID=63121 RepID=UPI00396A0EEA